MANTLEYSYSASWWIKYNTDITDNDEDEVISMVGLGMGLLMQLGNENFPTVPEYKQSRTSGKMGWYVYLGGYVIMNTDAVVTDGEWHHIAVVKQHLGGDVYDLVTYVDGIEVTTRVSVSSYINSAFAFTLYPTGKNVPLVPPTISAQASHTQFVIGG
jgi:hypothetical protein